MGWFALPLIGGGLLQQFYTVVDSIIIGRFCGQNGLSAVGVASSLISFLTFIISGIGIGMTVLLSKYHGAGNRKRFRETASTALVFGLAFTAVMAILCFVFAQSILILFQAPVEIMENSRWYMRIMCSGLIFAFLYNYYNAALLAIGNSKLPFLVLSVAAVNNICLTYLLGVILKWGVIGAALGSIISQFFSAVLCHLYATRKAPELVFTPGELMLDWESLKEVMSYSSISALQQFLFHGGKLAVQGAVNTLGVSTIAGYTAAVQIEAFVLSALEGLGTAVCRSSANGLGERNVKKIRSGFFAGLALSVSGTVCIGVILWFLAPQIICCFGKNGEVESLASGTVYLRYMAFFYMGVSVASILQSLFRGNGRMNVAIGATILQMIFRVGTTWAFVGRIGIVAIAFGTLIGWLTMIVYDGICAKRWFDRTEREFAAS